MAVRAFDLTEPSVPALALLEPAPLTRAEVRRNRQRAGVVATVVLLVPFVGAVIVLGTVS
jgi:hypothetical protein